MKVRFCNNSIRIRLPRAEVSRLARAEPIECGIDLVPVALRFRLIASRDCESTTVVFQDGLLSIELPWTTAVVFESTNQIGIQAVLCDTDPPMELLIEKDFKCLHGRTAEDQEDCFSNPSTER